MKKALLTVAVFLWSCGLAHATTITYSAYLSGPNEFPAVPSPGTGFAIVTYDDVAHTLAISVTFQDLVGTTTMSHIHCCVSPSAAIPTAGVATTTPNFAGFPLGVTSGTYNVTLDLTQASSYNPSFITANSNTTAGAEAKLMSEMALGDTYLNIHTTFRGGGEIRGFLTPVPEPATLSLLGLGLSGIAAARRKRRA